MTHKKGVTSGEERVENASKQQDRLKLVGTNHHGPERYANIFATFKHWLTYVLLSYVITES
jgi:hypothetical protein